MSMNYADLYGGPSRATTAPDPVSVRGPNQGSVAPSAGGSSNSRTAGVGAATSWVGFVVLLVALRLLAERAR